MSNQKKIAVGMSGGVDSSVAALLLKKQGHNVVGLTAHMWREGSRCCSREDIRRAERVCAKLGIPHYVVDLCGEFEELIVDPFVDEYAAGRTPSPCPLCNSRLKFGLLLKKALDVGATHVATGHYARVATSDDGPCRLLKGKDEAKDQSYFLFTLSQEQLSKCVFPLGEMTKNHVTELAREQCVPVREDGESQDLCFVGKRDYVAFVEDRRPELRHEGDLVDTSGKKLGTHQGIHRFTIGQRRALGVAVGEPMYVVRIDAAANTVVLGTREETVRESFVASGVNWIVGEPAEKELKLHVRIRYNHAGAPARVTALGADRVEVQFDSPEFAVTPGQCAVFYQDDEVVGGGWIEGGISG
jgi:tRNA-specific 2-thiouridylase